MTCTTHHMACACTESARNVVLARLRLVGESTYVAASSDPVHLAEAKGANRIIAEVREILLGEPSSEPDCG